MREIEKEGYTGKKRSSSNFILQKLALTAMLSAVAFVLGGLGSAIGVLDPWTYGGSVSLSSLPLVFIGLICGWQYGLLGGLAYAGIDLLMDNGYVYAGPYMWLSILLDYLLGFGFCFVSGFFRKPFLRHRWWAFFSAMTATMVLRFLCSFLSGGMAFGSYAPEGFSSVWIYSLAYNASYIGFSLLFDLAVGALLVKPIWSAVDRSALALDSEGKIE